MEIFTMGEKEDEEIQAIVWEAGQQWKRDWNEEIDK